MFHPFFDSPFYGVELLARGNAFHITNQLIFRLADRIKDLITRDELELQDKSVAFAVRKCVDARHQLGAMSSRRIRSGCRQGG
jgi:hypothetical protein